MRITTPQPDISRRRKGAVLAFTVLALMAPPPSTGQEVGDLEAVEPEVDLGTLDKGKVVEHSFVLRNTGKERIAIERLAHSCGCTVAEFDETIPAGGEGTVRAEIDTMSLNGRGSSSIEVYTESAADPAATLILKYNVVPKLLAEPGYARWSYVQHEEQGTIAQTVYSTDAREFDVVRVESPMSAIDVAYRPAEEGEREERFGGSQWRLESTLAKDAPVGPITGYIDVYTTHPVQEQMRIPVSGFVRPVLFVQPPGIDAGTLETATPRHAVFDLRNFATEPIEVTGVSTDLQGVTAQVDAVEEGRRYRVIVVFDPEEMEEGPFRGEAVVTTDSPKAPRVTIDLSGTFVRPAEARTE